MIATNDGIYVDECDPLFDTLETYKTWAAVKRAWAAPSTDCSPATTS